MKKNVLNVNKERDIHSEFANLILNESDNKKDNTDFIKERTLCKRKGK